MELWSEVRRRVSTGELSKRAACREYGIHWQTLTDSLKQASKGVRTPPDWWQDAKRKEQRSQQPTTAGQQVLSKLLDEVFGADRSGASVSNKPERAADLLKRIR